MKEADKVYNKRETEEEKEERRQKEQEARELRHERRQDRNLTRILATVVGEKRAQEERYQGKRQSLGKDQWAYCKEKGRWAKDCPKKKRGPPKTRALALEDSD